MTDHSSIESRFIAKALYRLGGRKIAENYTEAKALGVRPEMFSDPTCRVLWMAAEDTVGKDINGKYSMSDVVIRAKQIVRTSKDRDIASADPSSEFLGEAERDVSGDDSLSGYYIRLRDAYAEREVTKLYNKTIDAFSGGADTMEAIAMMQSGCDSIIKNTQLGGEGPSVEKIVKGVLEDFRNVYHHRQELGEKDYVAGMPFAWPVMTSKIGGLGSVMTTIAARTGVGKTSFAVALMRFWLRSGIKVVFNSLDMESREMVIRQMSESSLISSRAMKNGEIRKERFESAYKAYETAGDELIQYERAGQYCLLEDNDVDVLASKVRILKNQGKIDVLVVDYIQLLDAKHTRNEYDRITYAAKTLMRIANQVKIPVFALAQINRCPAKEGEEPELHDIKGSGEIEQDSANILIITTNKELKKKWDEQAPVQYLKNPAYTETARSILPMWVKLAKTRDAPPNFKIPFVVLAGKYSWYLGDMDAQGDSMFDRVHLNRWKTDPVEETWKRNGAVIDDEKMEQIEAFNNRKSNLENGE